MNPSLPRRDFLAGLAWAAGAYALYPCPAGAAKVTATNRNYVSNQAPLLPTPYIALPLGSVQPRGWLLKQMELQRDGLTGHAEELLDSIKGDSGWLGGTGEDWERGPYYLRGLVGLAYGLDDAKLKKKAQKWIDWILASQKESGYFGPPKNDDWWPRMLVTQTLRDYQSVTKDPKVLPFLLAYYRYMAGELKSRPLKDWGKARAGDEMETIFWVYNHTKEPFLLELASLVRGQAFVWPSIYASASFFDYDGMTRHNVNVPQAMKMPALAYLQSGSDADRNALYAAEKYLTAEHGLPIGINSGTESISGRSPGEAVETCSIVEKMLSQAVNLRILGDARIGDNLEVLAFNGLPGAMSKTFRQHVYYSRPNNIRYALGSCGGYPEDHLDGSVPGPLSGFPCCCYNLHMGWPKFTQNCWAASHDNGLAIMAYAPSQVTAKVGNGAEVTILEETNYPFEETIRFTVKTAQPVSFPLYLRVPAWCKGASLKVAGKTEQPARPGEYARLERVWTDGEVIELTLPMEITTVEGVARSASVHYGPLVFALDVEEKRHVTRAEPVGFEQYELDAGSPWNYALHLDQVNPASSLALKRSAMTPNPFAPEDAPLRIRAKGKKLPDWTVAYNGILAFDPPYSPVESTEADEELTLLPYASKYLRITSFPVLGKPEEPPKLLQEEFNGAGKTVWDLHGGGWYVKEGAFFCNSARPGGKAVAAGSNYTDFVLEAEVSVGKPGNAGLLFRVAKVGNRADDFSGYYVGLDPENGAVIAGKSNGAWKELARAKHSLPLNAPQRLRVRATGDTFDVLLNNEETPLLTFRDDEYKSGAVGLRQFLPVPEAGPARFAKVFCKAT